ncbi:MAG: outer membrane protein assembly factor BamD [Proteobacteria bacterium]|nr:MAG: outer membrane protein assembly factor BamD [Pseudomonadota bacterium]
MSINTTKLGKLLPILAVILLAGSLSACSFFSGRSSKEAPANLSADALYQTAKRELDASNYERAIKLYETLEARFPLGNYAQQAQLESAYAYYKYDEPDTALDTIDRFIRMNPGSNKMAYALYLRGLVNFNRGSSIIDRIFPRSIADLDIVRQKEAFHDFSRVVNRYPDSAYARDAQLRIQYLRNTLAESEVNVAKYYMMRQAWLAAFNRAEYAIKHYQGSPAVIDALEIKIKAASALGKNDLAADSWRVLETNFPERAARLRINR